MKSESMQPCPLCGELMKRLPDHLPCDSDSEQNKNIARIPNGVKYIWRKPAGKAHLTPDCPHVTSKHARKEVENFPADYVDLCKTCDESVPTNEGTDTAKCERCGTYIKRGKYCEECHTQIQRVRARQ